MNELKVTSFTVSAAAAAASVAISFSADGVRRRLSPWPILECVLLTLPCLFHWSGIGAWGVRGVLVRACIRVRGGRGRG